MKRKNKVREKTADNDHRGVNSTQFFCIHTSKNINNDSKMLWTDERFHVLYLVTLRMKKKKY